jgi:hypothetical protein
MRRLSLALISGVSAMAFVQMAAAGDVGRPVYEPLLPPPPLPVADWSGAYVGVESGYGSGHQNIGPAFSGSSQVTTSDTAHQQDFGGFTGAQKQLGDAVLGVETGIQHWGR